MVTWDPVSSPYCGEVLYYRVVILSDEHTEINSNIVNTTGLTVTFLDLRNYTTYTIMVAAVNKAGIGENVSSSVRTAAAEEALVAGPGSNTQTQATGMWRQLCVYVCMHVCVYDESTPAVKLRPSDN